MTDSERCTWCHGSGRSSMRAGRGHGRCRPCEGSGRRPLELVTSAAVEIPAEALEAASRLLERLRS